LAGSPERGVRADFAFELDPPLEPKRRDFTAVLLRKPAFATWNLAAFLNRASLARVERPSFEGGIKSGVPDGNGQNILFSESFVELNLLFTERCFWRPNVPELVVVHHTISTNVDSLVNPLAEFLFKVIHAAILLEKLQLDDVT